MYEGCRTCEDWRALAHNPLQRRQSLFPALLPALLSRLLQRLEKPQPLLLSWQEVPQHPKVSWVGRKGHVNRWGCQGEDPKALFL